MNYGWSLIGTSFALTAILICGLLFALRIVSNIGRQLRQAKEQHYTVLISRFPDPLILQFGYERKIMQLPDSLRLVFSPWAESLNGALNDTSRIAYVNRQSASSAVKENNRITLREKWLCRYRGFSVCFVPSEGAQADHDLATRISKGCLLVYRNTDQHRSLQKLLEELQLPPETHIRPIAANEDLLELALEMPQRDPQVIGFAGGITERLIAQKLGYFVAGQPDDILQSDEEANSLAYLRPDDPEESEDLNYVLDVIEGLWTETVRELLNDETMQNDFRLFLNIELETHLGPIARQALKASRHTVVSRADMTPLLSKWLKFDDKKID